MAPSLVADTAPPPPASALPSKSSAPHPYAPLTPDEITNASTLLRAQWPQGTDIWFKGVTLAEPPKAEMQPFLDAEAKGETALGPARKAWVNYYLTRTNKYHEAVVNLSEQKTEYNVQLGPNLHGPIDGPEVIAIEKICAEDESIQCELAKLDLPKGSVVVTDPWIYGELS